MPLRRYGASTDTRLIRPSFASRAVAMASSVLTGSPLAWLIRKCRQTGSPSGSHSSSGANPCSSIKTCCLTAASAVLSSCHWHIFIQSLSREFFVEVLAVERPHVKHLSEQLLEFRGRIRRDFIFPLTAELINDVGMNGIKMPAFAIGKKQQLITLVTPA